MADNIYNKLPIGTRTIRLVEVLPGDPSDIVQCTLNEEGLATAQPYKALSYAWEAKNGNRKAPIICNEKVLKIARNLEHAIRRLRFPDTPVTLWIDTLCINQADDTERTHQVGMMREIYENSSEVVIWLEEERLNTFGELTGVYEDSEDELIEWFDDDRDGEIVEAYNQAFERQDQRLRGVDGPEGSDMLGAFCLIRLLSQNTAPKDIAFFQHMFWAGAVIRALWAIMKSPWWSRTWVVQETVVAHKATILYSNMSAPWAMFSKAATNYVQSRISENLDLYGSKDTRDPLTHFSRTVLDIESTRTEWMNLKPITISSLLRKFRSREASDPRDKVFALLGLVKHWEYGVPIFPDYSLSPEEVFWRTTINIISSTRSLSVLVSTLLATESEEIKTPSWVTNWSVPPDSNEHERLGLQSLYNAALRQEGAVRLHGKHVLEVQGHLVDEIVVVGSVLPHGEVTRLRTVISQWLGLVSPGKDITDDIAGGNDAFWRTICGDALHLETGGYHRADASGEAAFITWIRGGNARVSRRTTSIIDSQWQDYAESTEVNKSKNSFHYSVEAASSSRAFCVTRRGYIGTGPRDTSKGDHVYVLLGSQVPFVVRPRTKSTVCHSERLRVLVSGPTDKNQDSTCSQIHPGSYSLVGDAYIQGYMEGQAIKGAAKRGEKPQSIYLI